MSLVSIRSALKAKLDARKTANVLGEVYDGEQDQMKLDIASYPVAELRRAPSEGSYFTNQEDLIEYQFDILLYAEMDNAGTSAAEKSLDSVIDDLIYQFAHDRTLGGVCDGDVYPALSRSGVIEWRGKPHYVSVITLKCRKVQGNA
jgi:hypothetical protein